MIQSNQTTTKEITMNRSINRFDDTTDWMTSPLRTIRQRMAKALIGQSVSIVINPKTIARGTVTAVLAETDVPQIIVDGMKYNFNQLLTNVPVAFSQ